MAKQDLPSLKGACQAPRTNRSEDVVMIAQSRNSSLEVELQNTAGGAFFFLFFDGLDVVTQNIDCSYTQEIVDGLYC